MVDAAFGELIRRAYAHHADLLKFGGDAVLLLFRGDGHAQRAGAAAVGMQEALAGMRRRSTSAGPVRLQMSIGVHSGSFHFFLVGGIHRELVIAGADATACVETEAIAQRGRDRAQRRDGAPLRRGSSWARAATASCCSTRSPDVPETVPPFFDPSGVDLVGAAARRLHARAARRARRPGAPARRDRLRRAAAGPTSCSSARARRRSPRRSRRASRRSRSAACASTSRSRRRT